MNGARSTYMRRGYLFTALAAAVLLAASSGTAFAQSVGFDSTSGTIEEGASGEMDTGAPVEVGINVRGLTLPKDATDDTPEVVGDVTTAFGRLTITHDADPDGQDLQLLRVWLDSESSAINEDATLFDALTALTGHDNLYGVPSGTVLPYDNNGVIRLVLIDPNGDGDWEDDEFSMKLTTEADGDVTFPPTPSPADYMGHGDGY